MRYTLEFAGFEPPADTAGYIAEDFLTADMPAEGFVSEEEAQAWLVANDKGPDCEGVRAEWRVEVAS